MMDKVLKLSSYLLCIGIGIFFVLGIFEGMLNLLGWTMWWIPYSPLKMLEFSAV